MWSTWLGLSVKGRSNPRQYTTKKLPPYFFVENDYPDSQYEFGDETEGTKNLSPQKIFVTRF